MAFLLIIYKSNTYHQAKICGFSIKSRWIYIYCLNIIQINFWPMLVLLWFHVRPKNQFQTNSAETSLSFWIFCLFVSYLCQVEGHGGTLPKFSLKIVKIFPLQIWKIFCFLISLCSPLSHGIWILDLHSSVKTLAFLDHCEWRNIFREDLRVGSG